MADSINTRTRTAEDVLPDDLIIQIFTWLPPEYLVRLRTLSKLWFSTISDPNFIQLHRSHFSNSSRDSAAAGRIVIPRCNAAGGIARLQIFYEGNASLAQLDITSEKLEVSGSCNGLLCFHTPGGSVMVCNPSIRRIIHLPDCRSPHPNHHSLKYGIGFDRIEEDYKILMVRNATSRIDTTWNQFAMVYSLKSKLWEEIETLTLEGTISGKSIFLHGSIHWLYHPFLGGDTSILRYDVRDKVFRTMPLPAKLGNPKRASIFVVRGSLCVIYWWEKGKYKHCQMWIMKKYGEVGSWTLQFDNVLPFEVNQVIGVSVGGKILCSYYGVVAEKGALVSYDGRSVDAHFPFQLILFDPRTQEFANVCRSAGCGDSNIFSLEGSLECLNF